MIRLQELELVFGHTTDGWTDRRDVGNSILDVQKATFYNLNKAHFYLKLSNFLVIFNAFLKQLCGYDKLTKNRAFETDL